MKITDEQITAAAQWFAKNVRRTEWNGLRPDGRARDAGFDPWHSYNARQEDYRDAVREMLSAMGIAHQQNTRK